MRRICSEKSDLVANVRKRKDWFKERGNPEDTVNKETKRSLESPSLGHFETFERRVYQVMVDPGCLQCLTTILFFVV